MRKTHKRAYDAWYNMHCRCYRKHHPKFPRYGGRGITVCDEWEHFEKFLADMGDCPEGMTLERVDNDKLYCKTNCIWASPVKQMNNTSRSRKVTYRGRTQTVTQWAREIGICPNTLEYRLLRGWSVERAIDKGVINL